MDNGPEATMRVAVVSGGIGVPSTTRLLADRLDTAVRSKLAEAGVRAGSSVVELRPLGRPIMDALLTGVATPELESAFEILASSDGLIAVTPAFNASFSGLFKAFFDVVPPGTVSDVPVLIAATGGTERHSLVLEHAMRPMFSYLHAIVSPTGVYAATDDFGTSGGPSPLSERISRAAADFARLLRSCGSRVPREGFADNLLEMERLLGASGAGDDEGLVED